MWPRVGAPAPPPVPAPLDRELQRRIDTLALFAARNGPAFVEYTREQQRGNDDFEFLEGGEGASYFDFRLHEAVVAEEVLRAGAEERRYWVEHQEEEDDARRREEGGREERGGGRDQQQQQQRPLLPAIDAFDLPPGLIPELVNAARTAGCRPHAPIRAVDAEAAAKVAKAEEAKEAKEEAPITPYLSARLAALEAELAAYIPGMTRADLEEKLLRARGGEATRGGGWEAVMRQRAAEAAAAATGGGLGEQIGEDRARLGDDGRFEGPRWLDRAGVGFEYRKKKGGGGGGANAAAPAAAAAQDEKNTAAGELDSDLASFRELQSRAYHKDGKSQRRQQQRR